MSKQKGYQSLNSTEKLNGEDYGFAARLPPASGSHPTDYALDADLKGTGTSGSAEATYPKGYPAAGAPVSGYPAVPMSARPVGMVVHEPLGMYGMQACGANGCRRGCRGSSGCHGCYGRRGCGRRRGGPVHLLFRLERSAYRSAQKHQRKQAPAPARKSTSEVPLSN